MIDYNRSSSKNLRQDTNTYTYKMQLWLEPQSQRSPVEVRGLKLRDAVSQEQFDVHDIGELVSFLKARHP